MAAKIGGIFRVVNGAGGLKTVERLVPETSTDAIPDFNSAVGDKLAANTVFKTAAQFASLNPVLLTGQFGQETDTKLVKLGDGTTAWNSLSYLSGKAEFKTAAQWVTDNTVLNSGSIGQEIDTGFIKIGNGVTAWNSLGYVMSPTSNAVVRKTAAQWIASGSSVLAVGQFGYETDTGLAKIGDGSTAYSSLPYLGYSYAASNSIIDRRTAATFTSVNPVLAVGRFGYETDTNRIKIGDGVTAWNSLPYVFTPTTTVELSSGGSTSTSDTITLTLS
jgi:hypothetical protein